MTRSLDVIVLGLGAMGSAAAYQLAKRGVGVLGIDRYEPPHAFGSTHGESRITRLACGEGPIYSALARRSHEIWREIEREVGADGALLTTNGMILIAGPEASAGHGVPDFLAGTERIARELGIGFESLSAAEIRSRFPAFAVEDDERAYLDGVSGFVRPERCVAAQITLARRHGARIRVNETVLGYRSTGAGVEVTTDKATYRAARLVVAAGPWLPGMLPPEHASRLTVTRQVLYWFPARSREAFERLRPERCPVFVRLLPPPRTVVYGFPALGTFEEGIKVATEQDIVADPSTVGRAVSDTEKQEMYETYVRPFLPGLTDRCVRAEVCLYTVAPGGRFVIDRHPSVPNVTVVSACSGHGFKQSPAIGELLAKMMVGEPHADIGAFAFGA